MSNSLPVSIDAQSDQRCQHIDSRGHRCRMLTSGSHDSLCLHHLNRLKAERAKNDQAVAADLLGPIEDFSSPATVNFFLGNLLKQLVHKRVRRRDALAQAYICQLLLNTFPAMQRELDSDSGAEACQLLLDSIAKSQRASVAPPPSGDSSDGFISPQPAPSDCGRTEPSAAA